MSKFILHLTDEDLDSVYKSWNEHISKEVIDEIVRLNITMVDWFNENYNVDIAIKDYGVDFIFNDKDKAMQFKLYYM